MLLSLTSTPTHGNVALTLGRAVWRVEVRASGLQVEAACDEFFASLEQAGGWFQGYGSLTAHLQNGLDLIGDLDPLRTAVAAQALAEVVMGVPEVLRTFEIDFFACPREQVQPELDRRLAPLAEAFNRELSIVIVS